VRSGLTQSFRDEATVVSYFREKYGSLRLPISDADNPQGYRPAQLAAAQAVAAHFFGRSDPAIVSMPTGAGKTAVLMTIPFLTRSRRVLVLTPSRLVREQIAEDFESLKTLKRIGALPLDTPVPRVASVCAQVRTEEQWRSLADNDVVVATVRNVSPATEGVAPVPTELFDLVLVDEAHHAPAPTWAALLDRLSGVRQALFTATPFRRDAKEIHGRLVFTYELRRARADGVFGELTFTPVVPASPELADEALAQAAEQQVSADKAAGLAHVLMVRTDSKKRADELARLYATKTSLRLQTITGDHSLRHVRKVLERLRDGSLDGVICVDMMGEGFDFPQLKVAALHSPHKSLAVTLQFVGRFARTTGASTGRATFLAVPSEIEIEAHRLFVPGAEWNELVEKASGLRIERETTVREKLESFQTSGNEAPAFDISPSLYGLEPYFHVKVLSVPGGVDFSKPLGVPPKSSIVFHSHSPTENAVICITREVSPCPWSSDETLADVSFSLFVLLHEPASRLLFISSSRRDQSVYDGLAQSVSLGTARLLSPDLLNRVLDGISQPEFFSIGLRNRSGFGYGESYRMITGPAADRAIQKSDGRFYDRGHFFGKGLEGGKEMTIGLSSSSKLWSNRWDQVPILIEWCRSLARKITKDVEPRTGSGLDYLRYGRQVSGLPPGVTLAAWPEEAYRRPGLRLQLDGEDSSVALLDTELSVKETSETSVILQILGATQPLELRFALDGARILNAASPLAEGAHCIDPYGTRDTLIDFLNEFPPSLYTADLARLEGSTLHPAPADLDPFDDSTIEEIDWKASGVDPLREKPANGQPGLSIFEWLEQRLLAENWGVVFLDDGACEMADYIVLRREVDRAVAMLFHCKAAGGYPVPGDRVADAYEVCGQAVRSLRWSDARRLAKQIEHRAVHTKSRFIRGTLADMKTILDGVPCRFEIVVVQPGIGTGLSRDVAALLAATNAYVVGAQVPPLRVIGSVRPTA
jgi:superfamily II DNA or RNA helicase